jgi:streptogramin lyase
MPSYPRAAAALLTLAAVSTIACGGGSRDEAQPTTGASSVSADGSSAAEGSADGAATGEKFDALGGGGIMPPVECPAAVSGAGGSGGGISDLDFTFVWIANSAQGTVSKIDTRTGVEAARYFTSPLEGAGDPSRTAVNPAGDVAVTSRAGGVTKIASALDRCEDLDGDGEIRTSTGPQDILPWGSDECIRWHAELPGGGGSPLNHQGPRPTAWDAGTADDPCSRLWVGWWHAGQNRGYFRRLSGADGEVLDEVEVTDWDLSGTSKNWGPYGGAVDAAGDLWVLGWGGPLVRIDGVTLEIDRWDPPVGTHPYGIALDADGHPWTAGTEGDVLHFDPVAETFASLTIPGTVGGRMLRGLAIDRDGDAWIAANEPCGLLRVDLATMTLTAEMPLPGCETPVGVGVDVDGAVWVPDQSAEMAFRFDPATGQTTTTTGLSRPYTYSDMTGGGLDLVVNPPTG